MTEYDLEKEVQAIIRQRIDKGQIAAANWVTEAVVSRHTKISGDDKEWYQVCAYAVIRSVVRKCVQRYKESPSLENDPQMVLEGFSRVQKAYLVERKKKQVVVPIDKLTSTEIDSKIRELRTMGQGCFEHADELSHYKDERRATA
jgi:magnesium-transporting ATPase (P-type)